jgi:hypothetical protein
MRKSLNEQEQNDIKKQLFSTGVEDKKNMDTLNESRSDRTN